MEKVARSRSREFIGVQYLRALAALAVVVYHFQEHMGLAWQGWAAGVDVFFVISGFIIWQTTQGRTSWTWWKARFWRIVPLYWLATTAMLVIVLARQDAVDWDHVLRSYLFIPTVNERGVMLPLLEPGWTLNYEMLFYTVMALAMLLKGQTARLVGIGAALVGLIALRPFASEDGPALFRLTSPILLEFLAGVALAVVLPYLKWRGLLGVAGLVAAVLFALLVSPSFDQRTISLGVPAALIVGAVVCLEGWMPRIGTLKLLGDASYSLYLVHLLVAVPVLWLFAGVGKGWPLFVLLVGCAVAGGVACYRWIERPLMGATSREGSHPRSA